MADSIFPLSYKPGLRRDGTRFQPEYCIEGSWIRFNEGKVKKIGGMVSPGLIDSGNFVSNILIIPAKDNVNKMNIYLSSATKIVRFTNNYEFSEILNKTEKIIANPPAELLWQTELVIDNLAPEGEQTKIAFLATNNAANIAQNTKARLFNNTDRSVAFLAEINSNNFHKNITGGMCYSAPYLFLYGENGFVQWSSRSNPFDFASAGKGNITISNDKVVWGRPIRGGSNSPSILFWTLSKVVRITNTTETENTDATFQIDVISNSSSILSARCVVEYDGLFFWPGTDRFFIYNGIVGEMVNDINLNYFFDNIDMNHRQKVFGVRNPRYGEIWWFYPEKGQDQENVVNTRALIYNKRENSWYDTKISRESGMFSSDFGFMASFGRDLTTGNESRYLWRHELNINEIIHGNIDNGIISSVTTPIISRAAFNPENQMSGIDRFIDLKRIEPDFVMDNDEDEIVMSVNTQRYARSAIITSEPISFTRRTEKIDIRVQGRNISLTFSSKGNFKLGNIMLLIGVGDGN